MKLTFTKTQLCFNTDKDMMEEMVRWRHRLPDTSLFQKLQKYQVKKASMITFISLEFNKADATKHFLTNLEEADLKKPTAWVFFIGR